jgi:hypothetical protein
VERWQEYQTALAEKFSYLPPEKVICEWEILGQSDQEVYVWTVCGEIRSYRVGLEGLAIVYIGADGSVYKAETAGIGGSGFPSEIQQMFPVDVQERYFGGIVHFQELVDHLRWRLSRPEEPPLIVRNATLTP